MVRKTSEWQNSGLVAVIILIVSILGGICRNDSPGQLSEELIHKRKMSDKNFLKAAAFSITTCPFNIFDYSATQIHPMQEFCT